MPQYENFYSTKLTAPLLAGDTIIQVVKAPQVATQGWMIIEPRNATQREIIWFSGVSGNTLTGVQRGQQNTMDVGHPAGVAIEQNPTARDFEDALNVNSNIPQAIRDVFGDGANEATFATNSGLVWSAISGLNAGMTAGAVYINGVRVAVSAVATRLFIASRDTYIDVDINGALIYTPVALNATAPVKAVNTVRIAKVVTSATLVTTVSDIREKPVKSNNVDFKTLSLNIKSALSTSSLSPSNGATDLGSVGAKVSFTVDSPCKALVTVSVGVSATADFEFRPFISNNGTQVAKFAPSAALSSGGRASVRGFSYNVDLVAGVNVLSAGVELLSGSGYALGIGSSNISAIVLGNVTA